MLHDDDRGLISAGSVKSKNNWRNQSVLKCAHIDCGMQSCMRGIPFRTWDKALLERSMGIRNFDRDDKIFSEGDASSGLYCLRSGLVVLSYKDAIRSDKALRMVEPGDLMGYRSLFAEESHVTTAEALTACHICFFPKKTIIRLTDTYPLFSRMLFRKLASDRGSQNALFMRDQHLPIKLRLIQFLRMMEKQYGITTRDGTVNVQLPVMRRQIASLISARPESVARAITELKREGLAIVDKRNVTIPNPGALDHILYRNEEWDQRE
jgi:CRP/FNR family transcriptional regulator